MAVVIQEMVAADAAGVMFSRDPVTGNPSRVVITANYGLGEVGIKQETWRNLKTNMDNSRAWCPPQASPIPSSSGTDPGRRPMTCGW
jgi:hypothetical protein